MIYKCDDPSCEWRSRIEKAIDEKIKTIVEYGSDNKVDVNIRDSLTYELEELKKELLDSEKSVPVSESVSDESLSGISGSQVNTCLSEKCERCQIYEKVINDIYNHLKRCDE